jgi:hypothetical protein
MNIFKEKHLNKVAVFVFNQLSAHVNKGDRALNAFIINLKEEGVSLP